MNINTNLQELIRLYRENKMSHAYLIETNNIDLAFQELKIVIKNIICPHEYKEECQVCNLCNLLNNNYLPSFIVIETDGKTIKKEDILTLKSRFSSIPIFTKDNIYIIKEAEKLNSASANTMLKFLEEPENNIIGFFITNNSNNVINTIKSRCEILRVMYKDTVDSIVDNPFFTDTFNYLQKLEVEKKDLIMYNKTILLSKYSERMDYNEIFKLILNIYREALHTKTGTSNTLDSSQFSFLLNQDIKELVRKEKIISEYLDDLNYNVNIELFLDKFVIELSDMYE